MRTLNDMHVNKHSASDGPFGSGLAPKPLNLVRVHIAEEARIALHHMAGEKGLTLARMLRSIVEDAAQQYTAEKA